MVLRAIAQRIRERLFDYAMLETLNNGKPITDAVPHDIPGAIGMFEYFAGTTFHSYGQIHDFPDATSPVHREPIGPVAQTLPCTLPLLMASFKMTLAPARPEQPRVGKERD